MTGSHLLDLLSHDDGLVQSSANDDDLIGNLVPRMISNSIETITMLRELRPKMFPSNTDPQSIAIAKALRVEFEEWVRDAEALYTEAKRLTRAGQVIPQLREFNDYIGMTQAMLHITLEDHIESIEQLRRGEGRTYSSIGELRRELQLNRKS